MLPYNIEKIAASTAEDAELDRINNSHPAIGMAIICNLYARGTHLIDDEDLVYIHDIDITCRFNVASSPFHTSINFQINVYH